MVHGSSNRHCSRSYHLGPAGVIRKKKPRSYRTDEGEYVHRVQFHRTIAHCCHEDVSPLCICVREHSPDHIASTFPLNVFTDGSYIFSKFTNTHRAGIAVFISPGSGVAKHVKAGRKIRYQMSPSSPSRWFHVDLTNHVMCSMTVELLAILEAVVHVQSSWSHSSVYIYTDSLQSLHLLQKFLMNPYSLREHKLSECIASIINVAWNSKVRIHLLKVKAHSRIFGNEEADKLAYFAANAPSPPSSVKVSRQSSCSFRQSGKFIFDEAPSGYEKRRLSVADTSRTPTTCRAQTFSPLKTPAEPSRSGGESFGPDSLRKGPKPTPPRRTSFEQVLKLAFKGTSLEADIANTIQKAGGDEKVLGQLVRQSLSGSKKSPAPGAPSPQQERLKDLFAKSQEQDDFMKGAEPVHSSDKEEAEAENTNEPMYISSDDEADLGGDLYVSYDGAKFVEVIYLSSDDEADDNGPPARTGAKPSLRGSCKKVATKPSDARFTWEGVKLEEKLNELKAQVEAEEDCSDEFIPLRELDEQEFERPTWSRQGSDAFLLHHIRSSLR